MNNSMGSVYKDFEIFRNFYHQRKKETEELIMLLQERVEAEKIYASKLSKIAQHRLKSITLGKLGEEVISFKHDCMSKARQSDELADNMAQDCIKTLKELLDKQEEEFFQQKMEGKILIQNLADCDSQVKQKAATYFRSAKDAEEQISMYENYKYSVDLSLSEKQGIYERMIVSLKKSKEKESTYKETVDNANNYLQEFRAKISTLIAQLHSFEEDRCEGIHSAVNKFVVYEKFSEMNNKYDVNNFSKILDEYKTEDEMATIQSSLIPENEKANQNKTYSFSFIPYKSKKYDIGLIQKEQITPPRERLQDYTNTQDLLGFMMKKIFMEMHLHEEYLFAMGKIFKSKDDRQLFVNLISKRFQIGSKVQLGHSSFQNIKDSIDLLLYAVHEDTTEDPTIYDLIIDLMKHFEIFRHRNAPGDDSLKFKIKDHAIWKFEKIWLRQIEIGTEQIQKDLDVYVEQMKEQIGDEPDRDQEFKSQLMQLLDKILTIAFSFSVPHETASSILDQMSGKYEGMMISETFSENISLYKDKQEQAQKQAEKERSAKKGKVPQKGIPDWMKELYDPLENLVNQSKQRESVLNGNKTLMSLRDLIRPSNLSGVQNNPPSQNDSLFSTTNSEQL